MTRQPQNNLLQPIECFSTSLTPGCSGQGTPPGGQVPLRSFASHRDLIWTPGEAGPRGPGQPQGGSALFFLYRETQTCPGKKAAFAMHQVGKQPGYLSERQLHVRVRVEVVFGDGFSDLSGLGWGRRPGGLSFLGRREFLGGRQLLFLMGEDLGMSTRVSGQGEDLPPRRRWGRCPLGRSAPPRTSSGRFS